MRILNLYLLKAVLSSTLLVLVALLAIAGFVEFSQQLSDVGEGNFEVPQALVFTLLRLPLLAVQMVPVAALIGALLGLGALAGHSELTVMRAAGVSKWRLARAVALSGVLLLAASVVIGEYMAPPLDQFARKYRDSLKHVNSGYTDDRSLWVRDGSTFFNIERITGELDLGSIYLFEFDDDRGLKSIGHALNAGLDSEGRWVLDNFVVTRFNRDGATVNETEKSVKRYDVDAELLGVSIVRPSSMSLRGLRTYIRYLSKNDLTADAYLAEFWGRIASTVAVVLMPILAIGFVFGSLRSSGNGLRILAGVCIGLLWYLSTRTLANTGQVYNLNVILTAWIPSLVLAAVTVFAVSRVR